MTMILRATAALALLVLAGPRQGFALALTEVLTEIVPFLPVQNVLSMLEKSCEKTGRTKNVEQRDLMFGLVFGLMALVRSGLVTRERTATAEDLCKVIKMLVENANLKPYMRELCFEVLAALAAQVRLIVVK